MALMTTGSSGLSTEFQTLFDKTLLSHAVQKTVLLDFAQKKTLPANRGATTVRYYRRNVADPTAVGALTQGVTPTALRELTLTPIDVTLVQYGERAQVTDILDATALFDTIEQLTGLLGEDCALFNDALIRDEVVKNITTTTERLYAGGATNFTGLQALSPTQGALTANDLLRAMTRLQVNRAPTRDGGYVAIVPPQVAADLMNDDKWVKLGQYSNPKALMNGEVGMIYGVRVVVATNPFQESSTQNTYDAAGTIFTSIITGTEAFGQVSMAAMTPGAPKIMVVPTGRPSDSDPLGQRGSVGWKAFWAPKLLNGTYAVTYRSKSAFQ